MSIEVKDVMGRVAVAVPADASFADVLNAMRRYGVGAVTVTDADRRPVGVVSEDDLLLKEIDPVRHSVSMYEPDRLLDEHHRATAVTAGRLMSAPAITVTPGTSVREAARLMHDRRVKQLPVIDPASGRIVGTLHQRDVLRVFARPRAELEGEVRAVLPASGAISAQVEQGVVRLSGRVERRSQAIAAVQAVRAVEGVVDVTSEVTADHDDLVTVPPPR
ncbi:CBS domain-containing protein [Nonomuraea sp. NPDC001831]|uniref:CBS domain-containing protein n=1 Tax=Nonomuraea sp. NPDC001831 TaxID=3364340 RepID=UPI0036784A79